MHAIKKKILPNIDQKFPILEIVKPNADTVNNIQPIISILRLFIEETTI
jgi:hypothetical protein